MPRFLSSFLYCFLILANMALRVLGFCSACTTGPSSDMAITASMIGSISISTSMPCALSQSPAK